MCEGLPMAVLGVARMGRQMQSGDGGCWVAQGGRTLDRDELTEFLRIGDPWLAWLAWLMCSKRHQWEDEKRKRGEQGQIACQCMLFCQPPFVDVLQILQFHHRQ